MSVTTVRRDASCRSVTQGSYILTRPGAKPVQVTVIEDSISSDLVVQSTDGCTRLDEVGEDVLFHRVAAIGDLPAMIGGGSDAAEVGVLLSQAAELRQTMRLLEDQVNHLLGSQTGDGSELSDAVCAAVRDGLGSSIELADLAGRLRR